MNAEDRCHLDRWPKTLAWILFLCGPIQGLAQGQDSTPGERNLLVMAELLPGTYDNSSQHDSDLRRDLAPGDQHPRIITTISRIDAPAFGSYAFLWVNRTRVGDRENTSYRIATLAAVGVDVVMRHYLRMSGEIGAAELPTLLPTDLRRTDGCDYLFRRREADHFRGSQVPKACRFEWEGQPVYTDNTIELSRSGLSFVDHKFVADTGRRITGVASGEPFRLDRVETLPDAQGIR